MNGLNRNNHIVPQRGPLNYGLVRFTNHCVLLVVNKARSLSVLLKVWRRSTKLRLCFLNTSNMKRAAYLKLLSTPFIFLCHTWKAKASATKSETPRLPRCLIKCKTQPCYIRTSGTNEQETIVAKEKKHFGQPTLWPYMSGECCARKRRAVKLVCFFRGWRKWQLTGQMLWASRQIFDSDSLHSLTEMQAQVNVGSCQGKNSSSVGRIKTSRLTGSGSTLTTLCFVCNFLQLHDRNVATWAAKGATQWLFNLSAVLHEVEQSKLTWEHT